MPFKWRKPLVSCMHFLYSKNIGEKNGEKTEKLDDISKKFGDEREKALNDALKLIEKDFGKGSIMRLGERAEQKVQVMSSGSLALDIALGAGGYPKGRIIEIYGPESSGKTTVALHAVAQAQKEGGIAAFIDAEHALDPSYAAALGSISTNFSCLNQTQGSKDLKLLVN